MLAITLVIPIALVAIGRMPVRGMPIRGMAVILVLAVCGSFGRSLLSRFAGFPLVIGMAVALMLAIALMIAITLVVPIALVAIGRMPVAFVFAIAFMVAIAFVLAIGVPIILTLPIGTLFAIAFRSGALPMEGRTIAMERRTTEMAPSPMPMSEMGLIAAVFPLLGQPPIGVVLTDCAVFDHLLDFFVFFLNADIAGQAGRFLLLAFTKQELQIIGLGIDFDAIVDQKTSGDAQAFDLVAFEASVMNVAGAARRGIVFENRDADAEETAGREGLLGARIKVLGDIDAFRSQNIAFHDFRRIAGNAQSALDFRAERNQFVFSRQFLIKRPGIIRPVIFRFFADQAGADKNFFHNRDKSILFPYSFLRKMVQNDYNPLDERKLEYSNRREELSLRSDL
jgi:hypothetical protein